MMTPASSHSSNNSETYVGATPQQTTDPSLLKHKRRFCRFEGCNRIVKSQGLCQRHGAKPRKCKIDGCTKQAQGNFDRMCKSHFKEMKRVTTPLPKVSTLDLPPPPEGTSVYDRILPASISFTPRVPGEKIPLIQHLKHGFDTLKPPAWHRNEERRARGMHPIDNPAAQLEGWERELVWMEILVLTGAPGASFRHLARAWGRDKGFHMVLAQFICERQGDVQRKKRQGDATGPGSRNPSVKRERKRRATKKGVDDEFDISANPWDNSAYGDSETNEALAADIFNFTAEEFKHVSARWKHTMRYEDSSEAPSSPGTASTRSFTPSFPPSTDPNAANGGAKRPPVLPALPAKVLAPQLTPSQQQPLPQEGEHEDQLGSAVNGPHDEIPDLPPPPQSHQQQHKQEQAIPVEEQRTQQHVLQQQPSPLHTPVLQPIPHTSNHQPQHLVEHEMAPAMNHPVTSQHETPLPIPSHHTPADQFPMHVQLQQQHPPQLQAPQHNHPQHHEQPSHQYHDQHAQHQSHEPLHHQHHNEHQHNQLNPQHHNDSQQMAHYHNIETQQPEQFAQTIENPHIHHQQQPYLDMQSEEHHAQQPQPYTPSSAHNHNNDSNQS